MLRGLLALLSVASLTVLALPVDQGLQTQSLAHVVVGKMVHKEFSDAPKPVEQAESKEGAEVRELQEVPQQQVVKLTQTGTEKPLTANTMKEEVVKVVQQNTQSTVKEPPTRVAETPKDTQQVVTKASPKEPATAAKEPAKEPATAAKEPAKEPATAAKETATNTAKEAHKETEVTKNTVNQIAAAPARVTPITSNNETNKNNNNSPTDSEKPATISKVVPAAQQPLLATTDTNGNATKSLERAEPITDDFPVDFVFTWYNGNDQATAQLREKTLASYDSKHITKGSVEKKRFGDAGEIKFALRGVEKHAPFVRNVFLIVGDGQPLPPWLNNDAPKLHVIRHSQIFPEQDALPTFNSFAIEAAMHNIPNLAEHFVYFNDDMFLNHAIDKSVFFASNGKPKIWIDRADVKPHSKSQSENSYQSGLYWGKPQDANDSYTTAIKNSNNLIDDAIPVANMAKPNLRDHALSHQGKALRKGWLEKADSLFHDNMSVTRHSKFRERNNVWSVQLATMLCLQDGECEHQKKAPKQNYYSLEWYSAAALVKKIKKDKPIMFCVNDGSSDNGEFEREMNKVFPGKSSFEE